MGMLNNEEQHHLTLFGNMRVRSCIISLCACVCVDNFYKRASIFPLNLYKNAYACYLSMMNSLNHRTALTDRSE